MRFSDDNSMWSNWESYFTSKTLILQDGDGQKTIDVQFMDYAGLTSTYNYTITLQTPQQIVTPTSTASPTPILSPYPTEFPSPSPIINPTASPSPQPTEITKPAIIPEAPEWILILIILSTLFLVLFFRKRKW